MHKFKKLKIWQKSLLLIKDIYKLTKRFPKDELFGLTSQLKRATISINLNIAEGSASKSDIEFRRFLIISLKSVHEVVAILEISNELGFIDLKECKNTAHEIDELGAMINSLIKKLTHKSNS